MVESSIQKVERMSQIVQNDSITFMIISTAVFTAALTNASSQADFVSNVVNKLHKVFRIC